jgi:hypothetical protein
MDISPPLSTSDATTAFAASDLFARMLRDMTAAIPVQDLDTPQRVAQRHEDARTMAAALHPADIIEAASAVLATVAYYASLALHACAAQPGQTVREATALCRRRARRAPRPPRRRHRSGKAPRPRRPPRHRTERTRPSPIEPGPPDDDPIPHLPQFQPRDRHGEPIPLYRFQDMTPKQRRATYGDPYNTATQAIAIEEEEEMIAAQKALAGSSAGEGADRPP